MFQEENFKKYLVFSEGLIKSRENTFTTLGPKGTSSYNTLIAFIDELKGIYSCEFQISLQNNFDLVFKELNEEKATYALIPAAYEKITEFFWSIQFENVYNFYFKTPKYGIASLKDNNLISKKVLRVASCPAVEKLYLGLISDADLADKKIEIITTHSTTEAAQYLVEGKVDLAITNKTSVIEYQNYIKFITKVVASEMLWCVFKKRKTKNV